MNSKTIQEQKKNKVKIFFEWIQRSNEIDADNGYSKLVGDQRKILDDLISNSTNYLRTINDFREFTRMAESDLT